MDQILRRHVRDLIVDVHDLWDEGVDESVPFLLSHSVARFVGPDCRKDDETKRVGEGSRDGKGEEGVKGGMKEGRRGQDAKEKRSKDATRKEKEEGGRRRSSHHSRSLWPGLTRSARKPRVFLET